MFSGFNDKSIISFEPGKKKVLSSEMARRQLQYGNDMGAALVQDANGYVFNTVAFDALTAAGDRKKFVGIVSQTLADQIARTETTSECECSRRHGLFGVFNCHVTDTKQRPAFVPVSKIMGSILL